jgi:hypothetical protein
MPAPQQAFGYSFKIDLPGVGSQRVNIPLEQMARDMAAIATNEAWPILRDQLYAELPNLMARATAEVQPKLRFEIDRATRNADRMADEKLDEATRRAAIGLGILVFAGAVAGTVAILWPTLTKKG